MDFDKTLLLSNIIDARRNGDAERLSHLILRYLSSFEDGVVYAPEGIVTLLKNTTETSKRTIYRHLEALERRNIFSKDDEFSLQLNDQFSSKGTKPVRYKGSRIIYDRAEQAFLFELETKRAELWNLRGKNKQRTKKDNDNMNVIIQTLTKQLDVKDRQIEELLTIVRKISCGEEVDAKEAKTKLALVHSLKE